MAPPGSSRQRLASPAESRSNHVRESNAQEYDLYCQFRRNPRDESQILQELKTRLIRSKVEAQVDEEWKFFLPRCRQASIISFSAVLEYVVAKYPSWNDAKAIGVAKLIIEHCISLFAILICKGRGEDIYSFMEEGISDKDLPLKRTQHNSIHFQKLSGQSIKTMQHWDTEDLIEFGKAQYEFIAPVFKPAQQKEYSTNFILPFIRCESEMVMEPAFGGYSQVFQKVIHQSHHKLWDRITHEGHVKIVAIKRLHSTDPLDFDHENEILSQLGVQSDDNPHRAYLAKLLGTYKQGSHYHLIFNWATSNLRHFWDSNPQPDIQHWLSWTLEQMTGVAGALKLIHNFRPTLQSAVQWNTHQRNALLNVIDGEKFWGRHGDIKPENFLYFRKSPDTTNPKGIIQISDFGLGRFHGRDSRSNISPTIAQATPTYEPPECQLRRPVSRKYDIWSLGCVFLEFLTWILIGAPEVYHFSEYRGMKNMLGIDDDKYFEIFNAEDGSRDARVKAGVREWVEKLRRSKRCSMLVHHLLSIIIHDMLVVDQNDRISSEELYEKLKWLSNRNGDVQFMMEPVESDISTPPRIQSPTRASATWPQIHVTTAN